MKYNFDKPTNRRGTGSLKWDVPENELPMWVADMDFETVPEVVEALKNVWNMESLAIRSCRIHGASPM